MSSACKRGQRGDGVTSGKEGWRGRLDEDGWKREGREGGMNRYTERASRRTPCQQGSDLILSITMEILPNILMIQP